jgi:hypothetical protein
MDKDTEVVGYCRSVCRLEFGHHVKISKLVMQLTGAWWLYVARRSNDLSGAVLSDDRRIARYEADKKAL